MTPIVDEVVRLISNCRFRYANEDELQEGIVNLLEAHGIDADREVRLSALDRIDVLAGPVGIEVKTAGAAANVGRQLARYAKSELINQLVLVTNRVRHVSLAGVTNGKPVYVIPIIRT